MSRSRRDVQIEDAEYVLNRRALFGWYAHFPAMAASVVIVWFLDIGSATRAFMVFVPLLVPIHVWIQVCELGERRLTRSIAKRRKELDLYLVERPWPIVTSWSLAIVCVLEIVLWSSL